MTTIKGVIMEGRVILKEPLTFPEGTEVEIIPSTKFRILKHAGIWKDHENIDSIVNDIYSSRSISAKEINL